MDKTAAAKIRKQNQRERDKEKLSHNVTQSPESVTNSPNSVTHVTDSKVYVTPDVTPQHPILRYLIKEKRVADKLTNREKMEAIVQSLKNHNQLGNVSYGIGRFSLPMTKVDELLECTGK